MSGKPYPPAVEGRRWVMESGLQGGHAMRIGSKQGGVWCESYPPALLDLEDPPASIHGIGEPGALAPGLAIVGARKATPYGISCAEHFAMRAAQAGITVVSGGAIGCDQAAHRGALKGGGRTVVVLGGGADVVYPRGARSLFQQVVDGGGALISEQPWGAEPLAWTFPLRNRIIAGLSLAVLVVEAGLPSGTFTTADAALSQGKEVMVVPGSIYSRESRGSNRLLAQGAIPIVDDESFDDTLMLIFGILNMNSPETVDRKGRPSLVRMDEKAMVLCDQRGLSSEKPLIKALLANPSRPEELLGTAGKTVTEVLRSLSRLETAGIVIRYRDGRFGVKVP